MTKPFGAKMSATRPAHAVVAGVLALMAAMAAPTGAVDAWEPSEDIEIIVPAGKGGGGDRVARKIQEIVNERGLAPTHVTVVNAPGGLGLRGYLELEGRAGDPHALLVTLSNIFTAPRVLEAPFHWTDLTPVALLALDPFVLWVNAESPYRSARDYLAAAADGSKLMGGTGAQQEDELITRALEQTTPTRFRYLPFIGGGAVADALARGSVDSSVNNPIEGVKLWRAGKLRPLCVFGEERLAYDAPIAGGVAWSDLPTCREAGADVVYEMMRGVFMPPHVRPEQVAYYTDLLGRVARTPEWREFLELGAFTPAFKTGPEFAEWLSEADGYHLKLLADAGLLTSTVAGAAGAPPGTPTAAPEGD